MSESDTKAAFIRRHILLTGESSVAELSTAWQNAGRSMDDFRDADVYSQVSSLRTRYGLDKIEDIPRRKNGELNMSGLIRQILTLYPDYSEKKVNEYISKDGLNVLTAGLYNAAKKSLGSPRSEKSKAKRNKVKNSDKPRARFVRQKENSNVQQPSGIEELLTSGLVKKDFVLQLNFVLQSVLVKPKDD